MLQRILFSTLLVMMPMLAAGQGQDGSTWERDLQVLAELLAGGFSNANQAYFDFRTNAEVKHARVNAEIEKIDAGALGEQVFRVTMERPGQDEAADAVYIWSLSANDEQKAVLLRSWSTDSGPLQNPDQLADRKPCVLRWQREAAQFTARGAECDDDALSGIVLSDRQLWLTRNGQTSKMHRVRRFECYADIPGVGGGRDLPYNRYDDLRLHDQGGSVTFTSKQGRELTISLLLVDWPINNYEGVFTRDSLVIYVSEQDGEQRKEHGYAFTVPEADRIGINLKWILAFCYMTPNSEATPSM